MTAWPDQLSIIYILQLIDWLVGWLVDWLIIWLISRFSVNLQTESWTSWKRLSGECGPKEIKNLDRSNLFNIRLENLIIISFIKENMFLSRFFIDFYFLFYILSRKLIILIVSVCYSHPLALLDSIWHLYKQSTFFSDSDWNQSKQNHLKTRKPLD